MIKFPFY